MPTTVKPFYLKKNEAKHNLAEKSIAEIDRNIV